MSELTASPARLRLRAGSLRLLGDERLARLAARGEEEAFAEIYRRYHQALYRYCHSILRHREDAADALQATMTAALRALPGDRREIALKPWLYRVAHNESISLLRRRRPQEELSGAAAVPVGGADRELASRERLVQLVADLRELPDRQRGALVMRELSGLAYGEIAAALDVSPAAAKQAVYHARTALLELAEGREMDCESARRSLSERDGRLLRGRKLRAHLRACTSCRDFEQMMKLRPADLAALTPTLPAAAAAALLQGVMGGGSGGGGGLAGLFGGCIGKAAAAGSALKVTTVGAVALVLGAGAVGVTRYGGSEADRPADHATQQPAAGGTATADRAGGKASTAQHRRGSGRQAGDAGRKAARKRGVPPTPPGAHRGPGSIPSPGRAPGGPTGVGGPLSGFGREQGVQRVPSAPPPPSEQWLGGDGQAGSPGSQNPESAPPPESAPLPDSSPVSEPGSPDSLQAPQSPPR